MDVVYERGGWEGVNFLPSVEPTVNLNRDLKKRGKEWNLIS